VCALTQHAPTAVLPAVADALLANLAARFHLDLQPSAEQVEHQTPSPWPDPYLSLSSPYLCHYLCRRTVGPTPLLAYPPLNTER